MSDLTDQIQALKAQADALSGKLAALADQAGGATRCHHHDLLHAQPTALHQRTPLFTGNREEVERLVSMLMEAVENV